MFGNVFIKDLSEVRQKRVTREKKEVKSAIWEFKISGSYMYMLLLEHKKSEKTNNLDAFLDQIRKREEEVRLFHLVPFQNRRQLWMQKHSKHQYRSSIVVGYSSMNWNKIGLAGRCRKKISQKDLKQEKEYKQVSKIAQLLGLR